MARIVFPDCTPYMAAQCDEAIRAILPGLEIEIAAPTPEAFVARCQGCAGLLHFATRISAAMLEAMPRLRVIAFLGTGVGSWVDLAAAQARGIAVRRVVGYGDRAVAEHALALILAAARKLAFMDRRIRHGAWRCEPGFEIAGRTLGIIGLGGVGRALARIGAALGCEVIGWNRGPVPPDVPCRRLPLDDVLVGADIVSLHLALNDETRGLIDERRIALLRPGAVLVNTARGGLVDEAALIGRLLAGEIAAGLDVFAEEPLAAENPLTRLDNVTLSAHAGWMTPEAARRLLQLGFAAMREEMDRLGGGVP
ncbi:MAG: 3-phosphoglycerate dehydrogenase [Alphaproteobacteria bacterium]|nr:3-phosphoglycerate dehydrogenase [Alphaproteobacteria bacterium]